MRMFAPFPTVTAWRFVRQVCLTLAIALASVALLPANALAQTIQCYGRPITKLDFRNPTLVSGTANSVGAIYRFSNVATGVDARVRINSIVGTLAIIDRDTGLVQNFQPELGGGAPGQANFTITLVVAGTTTPVAIDFAASGIDIDGDSGNLREYVEFSSTFSAYVLDANTALDVNASGPSVASNTRFESSTTATADGIDPNATQNIVSILYTGTSTFNYRIGSLGSGNTTRLTSLDFSCPVLPFASQTTVTAQDFGDAPASYGNPVHDIVTSVRIGATNTAELARYNSPNANGDAGDDGVTIPTLRRTFTTTIPVQVTGANGRLQAWIDFNGNGVFTDPGEQIGTDVRDNQTGDSNNATGTISLTFTVPANATLTQTFARFRWSTMSGLGPSSVASSGEVEDYALTILGLPAITTVKTSAVWGGSAIPFAVPGSELVYTVTTTNAGSGLTDSNSILVLDTLPVRTTFFSGDYDGAGPVVGPLEFSANGSTLTYTPATDIRYSNAASAPASFAACTYAPTSNYDANIRYICLNPKGAMASGGQTFTIRYRALIK